MNIGQADQINMLTVPDPTRDWKGIRSLTAPGGCPSRLPHHTLSLTVKTYRTTMGYTISVL